MKRQRRASSKLYSDYQCLVAGNQAHSAIQHSAAKKEGHVANCPATCTTLRHFTSKQPARHMYNDIVAVSRWGHHLKKNWVRRTATKDASYCNNAFGKASKSINTCKSEFLKGTQRRDREKKNYDNNNIFKQLLPFLPS